MMLIKKLLGKFEEHEILTPEQREVLEEQERLQDQLNMLRLKKERDSFH